MKENLQCSSKYGHLRISQDICHVRMTDIEGFLTIYGHSDNLLNNKTRYDTKPRAPGLTLENSFKVIRKWSIALSSTQISMWLVPYDQIGVQFSRLLYTSLCRERAAKICFSR